MSSYPYNHTAFKNDVFNEDSLKLEIAADSEIVTALSHISSSEDVETGITEVVFHFPTDLSSEEQTALGTLVSNHEGAPPMVVKWHASSVLTDHEKSATAAYPAWTELGGAVTTPEFFSENLPYCKGRVVGQYRTDGPGALLRIKEGDAEPSSHSFEAPNTNGQWVNMQWFSADPPTEGTHLYALEAQLPETPGATIITVKYVAVSLLEFGT